MGPGSGLPFRPAVLRASCLAPRASAVVSCHHRARPARCPEIAQTHPQRLPPVTARRMLKRMPMRTTYLPRAAWILLALASPTIASADDAASHAGPSRVLALAMAITVLAALVLGVRNRRASKAAPS